ncbi:MAG: (2Fe-2S)-binding protein [Symbiobacteriaceae bacterium]|jgi:carbon-monoxide dehydrogenase small subunit|nr:(2Fe-2S)-binding protein [Symbiobacteriaceae bacterium]
MELKMNVNGQPVAVEVAPTEPLLQVLRERLGLVGAKEPCGKGECGGCTVLMNGQTVNACLVMAAQAEGAEVLTVEGLAAPDGKLHPVQQAFVEAGAVQCGYCMTGMVMSAFSLLQQNPQPTEAEIKEGMEGNLCRCTGYQKVFDAVNLAAGRLR